LPKIAEKADSNIELLIVGNKTDLINEREVQYEELKELVKTDPNIKAAMQLKEYNNSTDLESK